MQATTLFDVPDEFYLTVIRDSLVAIYLPKNVKNSKIISYTISLI